MSIRRYSLATVAALAVVAVGWTIFQPRAERSTLSFPSPVAIARPAPVGLPPTARDLLDGGALDLSAAQRARLHALGAAWAGESSAAKAVLDAAVVAFSRFMDEARASGRTSLPEIQYRSAEISELSAALRERRQRHAEAAAAILTDGQRTRLGQMTRVGAAGGSR